MIRWFMRVFFNRVPTCDRCGHQMPEGPREELYWSGSGTDISASLECWSCRATWSGHYAPLLRSPVVKVYLAGDMVTDWRDEVMRQVEGVQWLVPTFRPDWFEDQVRMLDECDLLFAYIGTAARNIGTIAEMSAVRVMNKPRILAIHPDRLSDRTYDMAPKLASKGMVTTDMAEAIAKLRSLL